MKFLHVTEIPFFITVMNIQKLVFFVSALVTMVFSTGCVASRMHPGPRVGWTPPTRAEFSGDSFDMTPTQTGPRNSLSIGGDFVKVINGSGFELTLSGDSDDPKTVYLPPGSSTDVDLTFVNYSLQFYRTVNGKQVFLWSETFDRSGRRVERYYYTYVIGYQQSSGYTPGRFFAKKRSVLK